MEEITTATFPESVAQSKGLVLIDFWGPQCAPCLALRPAVEALAAKYAGKVRFGAVDASQNRRLCIQLRVLGLPTFLLFRDGVESGRLTGAVTAQQIERLLAEAVAA